MTTPEGLCTACSATQECAEHTQLIPVSLCVNDDHGYPGRLQRMDFAGALEIDAIDDRGLTFTEMKPYRFRTLRREWEFARRRDHVGNIFWNCYWMRPEDAAALLKRVRASKLFTLDGGWEELFRWFESGIGEDAWLTRKLIDAAKEWRL